MFVRLQAEKEMGLQQADAVHQQANISKLAECLPERTNTHVPIAMIKKHSREWQAHFQQISDYIVEGEGVWWRKQNEMVEFYDEAKHPTQQEVGPLLHHFRSSNLQLEATHLDRCWKKCIGDNVVIPTHLIRVDKENGSTHKISTNYLGDDSSDIPAEPVHEDTPGPADTVAVKASEDHTFIGNQNSFITAYRQCEIIQDQKSITADVSSKSHSSEQTGCSDEGLLLKRQLFFSTVIGSITTFSLLYFHTGTAQSTVTNLTNLAKDQEEEEADMVISITPIQGNEINVCESTTKISGKKECTSSEVREQNDTDTSNYVLRTHLGKALEFVIGKTKEVQELDKKRH